MPFINFTILICDAVQPLHIRTVLLRKTAQRAPTSQNKIDQNFEHFLTPKLSQGLLVLRLIINISRHCIFKIFKNSFLKNGILEV